MYISNIRNYWRSTRTVDLYFGVFRRRSDTLDKPPPCVLPICSYIIHYVLRPVPNNSKIIACNSRLFDIYFLIHINFVFELCVMNHRQFIGNPQSGNLFPRLMQCWLYVGYITIPSWTIVSKIFKLLVSSWWERFKRKFGYFLALYNIGHLIT